MASKVYLFNAANGQLFAARRVDPGDAYGPSYEYEVREPGVMFYKVLRGFSPMGAEEISPGHLRGTRMADEPLPLEDFMAHDGYLVFNEAAPVWNIDGGSIAAIQSFFETKAAKKEGDP